MIHFSHSAFCYLARSCEIMWAWWIEWMNEWLTDWLIDNRNPATSQKLIRLHRFLKLSYTIVKFFYDRLSSPSTACLRSSFVRYSLSLSRHVRLYLSCWKVANAGVTPAWIGIRLYSDLHDAGQIRNWLTWSSSHPSSSQSDDGDRRRHSNRRCSRVERHLVATRRTATMEPSPTTRSQRADGGVKRNWHNLRTSKPSARGSSWRSFCRPSEERNRHRTESDVELATLEAAFGLVVCESVHLFVCIRTCVEIRFNRIPHSAQCFKSSIHRRIQLTFAVQRWCCFPIECNTII